MCPLFLEAVILLLKASDQRRETLLDLLLVGRVSVTREMPRASEIDLVALLKTLAMRGRTQTIEAQITAVKISMLDHSITSILSPYRLVFESARDYINLQVTSTEFPNLAR